MGSPDNYDLKVLKTLQRIANSLDRIEKHLAGYELDDVRVYGPAGNDIKIGDPIREDQLR